MNRIELGFEFPCAGIHRGGRLLWRRRRRQRDQYCADTLHVIRYFVCRVVSRARGRRQIHPSLTLFEAWPRIPAESSATLSAGTLSMGRRASDAIVYLLPVWQYSVFRKYQVREV